MKTSLCTMITALALMVTVLSLLAYSSAFADSGIISERAKLYDVNKDNVIDISDVTSLLDYLANPDKNEKPDFTGPAIAVGSRNVQAGERTVEIPITVINNPGVSSVALDVTYSSDLTLTAVNFNTEVFHGSTVTSQTLESPAFISWVNGISDVSEDAVLATLVFEVSPTASGNCEITVSYDEDNVYDANEDNVFFETVTGVVVIDP